MQARTRSVQWQYYLNVVTASYSMTWWDEARWMAEVDFMALQGINLPLALTGTEHILVKVRCQSMARLTRQYAGQGRVRPTP